MAEIKKDGKTTTTNVDGSNVESIEFMGDVVPEEEGHATHAVKPEEEPVVDPDCEKVLDKGINEEEMFIGKVEVSDPKNVDIFENSELMQQLRGANPDLQGVFADPEDEKEKEKELEKKKDAPTTN